jgi:hypothetical protein
MTFRHLGRDSEIDIVDDDALEALRDHLRGAPALPNLRSLECRRRTAIHYHLPLLLAPGLEHLTIHPYDEDPNSPAMIASIQTTCPSLRVLEISVHSLGKVPRLLAPISQLVSSLWTLESLRCEFPLSPATICQLSRLSHLKVLDLADHPLAIVRSLAGIPNPHFVHLTSLCVNAWDGPSTASLLHALHIPHLQHLKMKFTVPFHFQLKPSLLREYHPSAFLYHHPLSPTESDMKEVFTSVQMFCNPSELRSFSIIMGDSSSRLSYSPATIRPLFYFRNLTSFYMDKKGDYDLDDDILMEMTVAWPMLSEFYFRISNAGPRNVTLNGLAAILSGCSQLKRLTIPISVLLQDVWHINANSGVCNTSVRFLTLMPCVMDLDVHRIELSELFAGLCPNLIHLEVPLNQPAWKIIYRMVKSRMHLDSN